MENATPWHDRLLQKAQNVQIVCRASEQRTVWPYVRCCAGVDAARGDPSDIKRQRMSDPADVESVLFGGEDVMEEDEAMPEMPMVISGSEELISKIIVPSPYAHHSTGATSARFRNALSRVTTDPKTDAEAWQALITEANACYRAIVPTIHTVDADTHAKLDWIESCYGALLKHFPYSSSHYVTVVELLMVQSARLGEEDGPYRDYGPSQRAALCEAKVERIFRDVLGIEMDGTPVADRKLGGICTSSVDLWLLYIRKRVREANRQPIPMQDEKIKLVREWTIKAYDVAIKHTAFVVNNHMVWKQYLAYVKSWIPNPAMNMDHALAQQQMMQLRSVYQRLVVHPMTGLDQLWQEYEAFERGQSEALAQALIAEYAPKYQHARTVYLERNRVYNVAELQMDRLATAPADDSDEDFATKMVEENRLLTVWKKRCSYERTNPERLSAEDLVARVRQAYKELVCVFTLYPEAWHMWSSWELLQGTSKEDERAGFAIAALQLGQTHIPDCTLLAYAEAQTIEVHTKSPQDSMAVMESFLERCPNTLGYVLYQQMVRRYKGMKAARAVFAQARRVLKEPVSGEAATKIEEEKEIKGEDQDQADATTRASAASSTNGKRTLVTNRPEAGAGAIPKKFATLEKVKGESTEATSESLKDFASGRITWQLYAAHAAIEHRLNLSPTIAARVYELGLRRHVSFLTKVPYVIRYAQLLMELQDTDNLRALLTRAVAACEEDSAKSEESAALWDITLQFESILSGTDAGNLSSLHAVERRRHNALVGPDAEDVSTGGIVSGAEQVGVGAQKTPLSEQLIRTEGYDVSSTIVSGMNRMVNVLGVIGLWTSAGSVAAKAKTNLSKDELEAGGKSDASFQRRLLFQKLTATGQSPGAALAGDTGSTSRILSARERLQQGGGTATGAGPSSALALAIQQSPDWLRPLLLVLPASRYRAALSSKPPPHMIEMALSTLRNNPLPPEPTDGQRGGLKRKHDAGDSSDEDNGGKSGGYGNQFRVRQRSRLKTGSKLANGS